MEQEGGRRRGAGEPGEQGKERGARRPPRPGATGVAPAGPAGPPGAGGHGGVGEGGGRALLPARPRRRVFSLSPPRFPGRCPLFPPVANLFLIFYFPPPPAGLFPTVVPGPKKITIK